MFTDSTVSSARLPAIVQWTWPGRLLVFALSATSIWCLLSEMYGLCDMRTFFYAILLPATVGLYGIALLDRAKGDRRLFRAVMLGTLAGLFGAVVYDVFRLPFVFSDAWGMGKIGIPQMPLFKVFPRFGALILAEPLEQGVPAGQPGSAWGAGYSLTAHVLGWLYHFSNGATFGVMFAAMYAGAREAIGAARAGVAKPMWWAALMAVGIEICMLVSPYPAFFGIPMTMRICRRRGERRTGTAPFPGSAGAAAGRTRAGPADRPSASALNPNGVTTTSAFASSPSSRSQRHVADRVAGCDRLAELLASRVHKREPNGP